MEQIAVLATILNAALEHVPPHTRSILQAPAQQAVKALEAELDKSDGQSHG